MGEILFRPAERSDVDELTRLINAQYARKKTSSYFLWQYFESCYPTIMMCAYQKDMLIGTFGLQRRTLHNGIIAGQAIDLLVVPEWRGKGIFKELGQRAIRFFHDLDVLCVLPNLNGKIAAEKSLGWKTIGKINSMCRNVSEMNDRSETEQYDRLPLPHLADSVRFTSNATIRQWRFEKNPIYKYDYVRLDSASFAVTKVFRDPVTHKCYGDIVDFEYSPNDGDSIRNLLKAASAHLQKQQVETVTTWALPEISFLSVTKSLGFVETPQERYFCLKVLKPEYDDLYHFSRWQLVQADAEVY